MRFGEMTIRYKCDQCGSVLKIKDELAGTDGKCPKCKTKFVVPAAEQEPESAQVSSEPASTEAEVPSKQKAEGKTPPRKEKKGVASARNEAAAASATDDEDFDPMAILMEEDPSGGKPSAGLASPPPETPKKNVDTRGRRRIMPAEETDVPDDASSAAAAAGAAMNASANARDLLSKTAGESRQRAASMPGEERGPRFDFSTLKYQLVRGAPIAVGAVVAAILLYWGAWYMMADHIDLPKLSRVSGTIMVDEKPLANVKVNLTPVNPKGESTKGKELRLRTATGITDENGYYEVEYMSGIRGAPVGKVRIWLEPLSAADFQKVPAQYSRPSQDIREVREAGNAGNFDLSLKSPSE
jgi:uncharacterized Zn finger protein (UPF0148 family)